MAAKRKQDVIQALALQVDYHFKVNGVEWLRLQAFRADCLGWAALLIRCGTSHFSHSDF